MAVLLCFDQNVRSAVNGSEGSSSYLELLKKCFL